MEVPNVQAVLNRARELKAIEHKFDQAGSILALSMQNRDPQIADHLHSEGKQLAEQADKELASFYERHPNCLSRKVTPWAQ